MSLLQHTPHPCQGLFRTLTGFTTLLALISLSSCGDEEFIIPDPPSFNWKAAIYQNPVSVDQITQPECDTLPRFSDGGPPFDGYRYFHQSADPVVWKIKLNKSRRDLIAYISYYPDLNAEYQQSGGYAQIQIKDLISGEVTVVDQMTASAHLGFDFAGDYLIYERDFEGYLYNWKTKEKENIGKIDAPSLSPSLAFMSFIDDDKNQRLILDFDSRQELVSRSANQIIGNVIWENGDFALHKTIGSMLRRMDLANDTGFQDYLGPFNSGLGSLIGFSSDGNYLYGNTCCVADRKTLEVNILWKTVIPENCQNRKLADFFILPDNTFMMRKTYFVSDHEKRSVYPEYHWHLFDANGSNERRVDLQF